MTELTTRAPSPLDTAPSRNLGFYAGWAIFVLAVVLLPLGLWLGANGVERALLAGGVLLVLIVELLNSGVEAAVDRISAEHHELAKRAKDYGSAAVMLSLVLTGVVWALILLPRAL